MKEEYAVVEKEYHQKYAAYIHDKLKENSKVIWGMKKDTHTHRLKD
jgi:preprotein translocase subunit SecE